MTFPALFGVSDHMNVRADSEEPGMIKDSQASNSPPHVTANVAFPSAKEFGHDVTREFW